MDVEFRAQIAQVQIVNVDEVRCEGDFFGLKPAKLLIGELLLALLLRLEVG